MQLLKCPALDTLSNLYLLNGMHATCQVTYPLDTLRLRLAVDPSLRGVGAATVALLREGGAPAFYRGLGIALLGMGTVSWQGLVSSVSRQVARCCATVFGRPQLRSWHLNAAFDIFLLRLGLVRGLLSGFGMVVLESEGGGPACCDTWHCPAPKPA